MKLMRLCVVLMCLLVVGSGCGGGGGNDGPDDAGVQVCEPGAFEPSYSENTRLHRFSALPVTVYFQNNVTYAKTTFLNDVTRSGFDEWVNATGGVVRYVEVDREEDAQIKVQTQVLPAPPTDGAELGEAKFTFVGNRQLSAQIILFAWDRMLADEVQKGFRATAAHEFGHALGIVDHSNRRADLMFPSKDTLSDVRVSTRDANTLKTAYCTHFGRSRAQCAPASSDGVVRRETVSCRKSRVVGGVAPSAKARRNSRGE